MRWCPIANTACHQRERVSFFSEEGKEVDFIIFFIITFLLFSLFFFVLFFVFSFFSVFFFLLLPLYLPDKGLTNRSQPSEE